MQGTNFEFKAKVHNVDYLEQKLKQLNPIFIGIDHQIDTYYNVLNGRLKLREGNIENALIHYERTNDAAAKQSKVLLYKHTPNQDLKKILEKVNGIKVVVDKIRSIYFIENVKFHFDNVKGLGFFVEVEAITRDNSISVEKLKEQCDYYANFFEITKEQFIAESYSDLLLKV